MKAPILIRNSLVPGNVPVSLLVGELGINEADSLLFYRGPTGVVTSFNLAGGGGGGAPINSPVFTGDPKAPTPTAGDNDTSIATTAFVTTAITGKADTTTVTASLALKANLASPTFTGDPKAPTPTAGDNDTSIATTAFVQTALASKADTSALTAKADLASPTFTGDPKAPTPSTGDNDTSIATTAFVKAQSYLTSADLSTYAPLASPALSGNPTAPTPAAGDADTSIATTAFVATYFEKLHGIGQCYLSLSGANLLLAPRDGNLILINGALVTIPDAGVTLAPTGTAATTLYYIYAYWTGSAIALEFSTTTYATQTGTGVKIKSGNATRTLVGMWSSAGAGVWSTVAVEGVSYFNPIRKMSYLNEATTWIQANTTSTSFVEMYPTYRQQFVTFSDRAVEFGIRGRLNVSTNSVAGVINVGMDAVNQQLMTDIVIAAYAPDWHFFYDSNIKFFSEARHYISGVYRIANPATLTVTDTIWFAIVRG